MSKRFTIEAVEGESTSVGIFERWASQEVVGWPEVPRMGDRLSIHSEIKLLKIFDVQHRIVGKTPKIVVRVRVKEEEFRLLSRNNPDWKIEESPAL